MLFWCLVFQLCEMMFKATLIFSLVRICFAQQTGCTFIFAKQIESVAFQIVYNRFGPKRDLYFNWLFLKKKQQQTFIYSRRVRFLRINDILTLGTISFHHYCFSVNVMLPLDIWPICKHSNKTFQIISNFWSRRYLVLIATVIQEESTLS